MVSSCQQGQGGTRWNPTQEQIEILDHLYNGGMRTPDADQIEQIATQLRIYGKIEGKNVFYWFQNHKARERQKHKRYSKFLISSSSPPSPSLTGDITNEGKKNNTNFHPFTSSKEDIRTEEQAMNKRKCRTWMFEGLLPQESTKIVNDDHYRVYNTNKHTSVNSVSQRDDEEEEKEEETGYRRKKTLNLFPLHPEGKSAMSVPTT